MAVPPFAETPMPVLLLIVPPLTPTSPPQVSPTPMALPALPPELMAPRLAAPPLAPEVATPPLPAEAVNCANSSSLMMYDPPSTSLTAQRVPHRHGGCQDCSAIPAAHRKIGMGQRAAASAILCRLVGRTPSGRRQLPP